MVFESKVRVAPLLRESVANPVDREMSDSLPVSAAEPPALNSSVALLMDQDTQQILLRKNDTAVVPIASLTKLMTGLLIADAALSMAEPIRITSADVDRLKNSGSRLAVGAVISREEALHLALMSSENRAAHALARTFPGGGAHFVQLMNLKAAELGMRDTRFVDPTGLSSENRSSARDLAVLATAAAQRPMLRDLSTSRSYEVATGRQVLQYRNSNRLVLSGDWDIGLQKTGYIREAGRCLLMQVNVAGRQLIMVLLDATGPAARLGDAERVRRWAETLIGGGSTDNNLSFSVRRRSAV
jgi:D-alanyl-D-alanine endopeptidase (penicillin-binding protein 7)